MKAVLWIALGVGLGTFGCLVWFWWYFKDTFR